MRSLILWLLIICATGVFAQSKTANTQIDLVDILHYKFDIRLNDTSDIIDAAADIKLRFLQQADSFYLNLVSAGHYSGMIVSRVADKSGDLRYVHNDDKLYIYNDKWEKSDNASIRIMYSGIPSDGLIISKNRYGQRTFFGDNWPDRARNWLPVIDHPSDKATVEFILEVPGHYDAIASGSLAGRDELPGERVKYHFSTSVPLPTKVMVAGIADFKSRLYGYVDSIPVSGMIFSKAPDQGLDDYAFSVEAMQFFIDLIGDYPYEKLANVQSKTIYGGMENAGNIFYHENTIDGRKRFESLVAHEVAHQWFGNSVTEKDWHHIWLSEGFATYLTSMYMENKYGKEVLKNRMRNERTIVAEFNDEYASAIIDENISDLLMLLNPNTYQKAAWVLHMLRDNTGDEDFIEILRAFYRKYRDKNAGTDDFIEIVNSVTGQDHRDFFDQWLYKKGLPDLDITWHSGGDIMLVEVIQKNDVYLLDLPVRISSSSKKKDFVLKIRGERDVFAFPLWEGSDQDELTINIDPDVVVLQKNAVKNREFGYGTISLIEGGELLKPGDLLFQDLDCGPLCDAIESVTSGIDGARFSHIGVVSSVEEGRVLVAEALSESVKTVELTDYLNRYYDQAGRPKVMVGRLKDPELRSIALESLQTYIGKSYDNIYDVTDDTYYCSELVYFLYSDNEGRHIFSLEPMTFKVPGSDDFNEAWIEYYKKLGADIPEGKPGINPGGISRSDKLDIIYRFGDPDGWRRHGR